MRQPYTPGGPDDPSIHAVAAKAIELITDGARVGIGGSAVTYVEGTLQIPDR